MAMAADASPRVGPVPGRVLVDLMMGFWGGLFCLLVVDLVSRFAGLPIPGTVVRRGHPRRGQGVARPPACEWPPWRRCCRSC